MSKLSVQIKEMIKQWEGCRLTAYRCPAGVLTIGYGHTGPDVRQGMTISRAQADELFDGDIGAFARQVDRVLAGVRPTQNQYDALVSLAYNIGAGRLQESRLLKLVRADAADPAIEGEFMKYVNAGGRQLPGLVRRRRAEANHYFGRTE